MVLTGFTNIYKVYIRVCQSELRQGQPNHINRAKYRSFCRYQYPAVAEQATSKQPR